jgi:hypothetical protein
VELIGLAQDRDMWRAPVNISVYCWEIFEHLQTLRLLKKGSTPRSRLVLSVIIFVKMLLTF